MIEMNTSKVELIKNLKLHDNDCGSVYVQIASLSYDINLLTNHLNKFKKDFHSKRGLIQKVNRRKRLLKYLKNEDQNKYISTIKYLKIRK